jgi:hypothetical protein
VAKKAKKAKSVGSFGQTKVSAKTSSKARHPIRSADKEGTATAKPKRKRGVAPKVAFEQITVPPPDPADLRPRTARATPQDEAKPPRKKKFQPKKYVNETPEQRAKRDSLYAARWREKHYKAEALAQGFESYEDLKLARRHARQEKLNREEIDNARGRGAYSKLAILRRALASLAEAINAEFNKPPTERGDFREIAFRIQHLANIKQII